MLLHEVRALLGEVSGLVRILDHVVQLATLDGR